MASPSVAVPTPDFISFLFSDKPKFDCYLKVDNISQGKQERIGAVKLMLMAHSEVFRVELEYSDLREKEDVLIKDIHADTFKGMLKYVYGHDTTQDMIFEEADNLLYVAEKYMMKTLKDKLALRLMKLLNYDNICSLLNNPACYTHLELNSAITDILRQETDHILASEQFLWMNPNGFLKILEQEELAVTEIELWRAAISWAKHRTDSWDGRLLREQLTGLTQHIRLCSVPMIDFGEEVVTTDVLTKDEIDVVCQSIGRKRKPEHLRDFSNETKPRKILKRNGIQQAEITFNKMTQSFYFSGATYSFTLLTKFKHLELLPLVCQSATNSKHKTNKVYCTIVIRKFVAPDNEPLVTVSFSEGVESGAEFVIPLAVDGRNITLQPETKYEVVMVLSGGHKQYYSLDSGSSEYENDNLTLDIFERHDRFRFPSTKLQYNVVTTPE